MSTNSMGTFVHLTTKAIPKISSMVAQTHLRKTRLRRSMNTKEIQLVKKWL